MAREKLFHVGVKAFITNSDGQILLFLADTARHKTNTKPYWDIPGGRIQGGESVLETLAREVEEETGVTQLEQANFFTAVVSKHEIPIDNGVSVGLVLMVYKVVIPADSAIIMSQEHSEYAWCDPLEAAKRLGDKYPTEFTDIIQ